VRPKAGLTEEQRVRRIKIFDTTLRDGEQSPGITLRPDEKAEVASILERLGVDVIEAGFAAASPGDFEGVSASAAAVSSATVASLARTSEADIDAAAAALDTAEHSRIHVFIATSALHMERKLGLTPDEVLEQIRSSVAYAVTLASEVEFSA
jgi:2-isopropylmalate synthase